MALLWPLSRVIVGALFYGPLRMRVSGRDELPRAGGVLVVSNHVSVGDPAALVLGAYRRRRLRLMGMSELFGVPLLGWYLRGMGAFSVVRDSADHRALRTARELLLAGEAVGIFPEGRVSRSGQMRSGGAGVGFLALTPGITVVPAAIWGTQRFRGPVRVRFGPPLAVGDWSSGTRSARSREAAERIMAALADLVPDVGGPAQPSPGCGPRPPSAPGGASA